MRSVEELQSLPYNVISFSEDMHRRNRQLKDFLYSQLYRHYRVVRPDMRGFGASTPMPRDFPWALDVIIDDYCRLMDALGIDRFHVVAAKIGGTIARAFAARRPERVRTLTVVGTPTPFRQGAAEPQSPEVRPHVEPLHLADPLLDLP